MKSGDRFMIGNPSRLYCECLSVTRGIVLGRVINGAWEFHLNLATRYMTWISPSGPQEATVEISFLGPWPKSISYDNYNDMMAWVNEWLKKPKIVRWWLIKKQTVLGFTHRLKTALRAFQDSWNGPWHGIDNTYKKGSWEGIDKKYREVSDDDIHF